MPLPRALKSALPVVFLVMVFFNIGGQFLQIRTYIQDIYVEHLSRLKRMRAELRIPSDPGQSFRRKPATCSERRRPAIPS